MTDLTVTLARPRRDPGATARLCAVLREAHRWAYAVLREYYRSGPAGLLRVPDPRPGS